MSDELDLCKKLINIFGNANKRGLCPSNSIVNNNKTEPESLLEYTVNNSDFIFMESYDGVNLPGGFTVDDVISCNTNLWISAENFDGVTEAPITDTENNIYTVSYDKKVIIIGNEANGVSKKVLEIADEKIKIPMLGKTESLNAAVATGIVLYEYVRRQIS